MSEEYKVKKETLEEMRRYFQENFHEDDMLAIGPKLYTWVDFFEQEVEKGTPLGIRYAKAWEEGKEE